MIKVQEHVGWGRVNHAPYKTIDPILAVWLFTMTIHNVIQQQCHSEWTESAYCRNQYSFNVLSFALLIWLILLISFNLRNAVVWARFLLNGNVAMVIFGCINIFFVWRIFLVWLPNSCKNVCCIVLVFYL